MLRISLTPILLAIFAFTALITILFGIEPILTAITNTGLLLGDMLAYVGGKIHGF